MKMNAKKLAPSRKPTAFAPASVFRRKIRSGMSGDSTVVSIQRNAMSETTEVASRANVSVVTQPTSGAREIAYTKSSNPAVTVSAPNGS